ncbi:MULTISPECIES: threonine ammonia-lyase [Candidatus Ichthyocystis]|uniref:Putative threonine dehydratase n=1 Tax=Candidatus Ichthyocystis hellenicum TaxID=1561003 RepID=A0A0S4M3V9_9BURK|nr:MULTISPECIES: threonine/serine dehydratase [Ichthyocystis]CUT17418.1 putative threonine dehydratase [Candidatus Ichthyocystis hellenicum]
MDFDLYFQHILAADVSRFALSTPIDYLSAISNRLGCRVFSKREDLQPVHSFKIRGVSYKLSQLLKCKLGGVLVAPSTGNHAVSVSYCAQTLGYEVVVVMPQQTPRIKIDTASKLCKEVIISGENCQQSCRFAEDLAAQIGAVLVHPYDDPDIIVGHATMAREIVSQLNYQQIKAIFVPIGGGALISSVALYMRRMMPKTKIIGVQYDGCDGMRLSLRAGKVIVHKPLSSFASAIATEKVGEETFRICNKLIDDVMVVGYEAVVAAIDDFYRHCRIVLEPAGAISLAALKEWCPKNSYGSTDVMVTLACGSNADLSLLFNNHSTIQTQQDVCTSE